MGRVRRQERRKALDNQMREHRGRQQTPEPERGDLTTGSSNCTYVDKLRCFYTNTDTLMNKRLELAEVISKNKPDIIALTEILDKNRSMDPEHHELVIQGYDHHTNIDGHRRRGVILYTRSHLNICVKEIPGQDAFEESILCELNLKGTDKLLLGVVYRSPGCPKENHDHLRTLMKNATELGTSHILVVGDFNYSEINWKVGTMPNAITNPATAFVETLRDLYLHQHIMDPTHYRANQQPNTLDLVITNEEGMVDNVALSAPVGKSHHTCITFDFMCYTE